MTRRSFGAVTLPVLGAAFSCSFGDDEEDDDKPDDKPVERRRSRDARAARPDLGAHGDTAAAGGGPSGADRSA